MTQRFHVGIDCVSTTMYVANLKQKLHSREIEENLYIFRAVLERLAFDQIGSNGNPIYSNNRLIRSRTVEIKLLRFPIIPSGLPFHNHNQSTNVI